eukprot:14628842-Alexandrium_andersonii.AAC.1
MSHSMVVAFRCTFADNPVGPCALPIGGVWSTAMAPKKQLTNEEKAQALQVRANALNSKAAFQRV